MSKKRLGFLMLMFAALAISSIVLAACARPGTTSSTANKGGPSNGGNNGGGGGNTVHMGPATFVQSSITISKGSKLTLVDDVAVPHIIANGMYDASGAPKPAKEPGAPTVNNVQFSSSGDSKDVGPFTTAGTYHLYCTIHVNMNLTITVK
ncbi:MAG: plastocyanin/azurin family copper-binding protein [Ktedonobacteraceae bacterium]|jgi:plastocyanin